MSKEEIEKQLKLSKRQSKDERYDYLCSEFNAINYCINLEKYTNKLQQENKQLKEVIEEVREYIEDWLFDAGGNGASMNYEDINELLKILDKAKN